MCSLGIRKLSMEYPGAVVDSSTFPMLKNNSKGGS